MKTILSRLPAAFLLFLVLINVVNHKPSLTMLRGRRGKGVQRINNFAMSKPFDDTNAFFHRSLHTCRTLSATKGKVDCGNVSTVSQIGNYYGRLGNRIHAMVNMISYAEAMNCNVELPPDMLSQWNPPLGTTSACLIPSHATNGDINTCQPKLAKEWYTMTKHQVDYLRDSPTSSCAISLLSSYFGINETHVLDRACPVEPHTVLHIRTGDVVSGEYDTEKGVYQPKDVPKYMTPNPTSFYIAVVEGIVTRNQGSEGAPRVYILCEDLGNPTCEYFQKTASLIHQEVNFTFRVNQNLIEDLHLMLCAREVAVSNGTFQRVLSLSPNLQIKHRFSREPSNCTAPHDIQYWIANEDERNHFELTNGVDKWSNTGHQRHIMNAYFKMASCPQKH